MRIYVPSFLLVTLCVLLMSISSNANSYLESDDDINYPANYDDILQISEKRSPRIYVYRRSCVRRGGNCDHRPNDCCYNSSCRCNLWGSNCRCQRMGLFQKWG